MTDLRTAFDEAITALEALARMTRGLLQANVLAFAKTLAVERDELPPTPSS